MSVPSSLIHPMRFSSRRPHIGRVVRLYGDRVGRRYPDTDTADKIGRIVSEAYNDQIMQWPFELRPQRPMNFLGHETSLAIYQGKYAAFGRNCFVLSPELVEMLSETDLSSVRLSDVEFPFSCFYVSFGDAFKGSLPGPENRVDGAYIDLNETTLQVLVTSRRLDVSEEDFNWVRNEEAYYYAPLKPVSAAATFEEMIEQAVERDDIQLERRYRAQSEQVARGAAGREVRMRDVGELSEAERVENAVQGLPAFGQALALAINAICYLNATADEDPVPTALPSDVDSELLDKMNSGSKKERQRVKAELLKKGVTTIKLAGAGLARAAEADIEGDGEVATHWRRGHWRRQAVGQGRKDRRLTWIRPTLVRADRDDEPPAHMYQMGPR